MKRLLNSQLALFVFLLHLRRMNLVLLTRKGFALLLLNLDPVPGKAAEKYEELRLRLVQYFRLSCDCPESHADVLADKTLDRIALKLEQGTLIRKIGAYA